MRKPALFISVALVLQLASLAVLFALLGNSAFIDGDASARQSDMWVGYVLLFVSSVVCGTLGSMGTYEALGADSTRAFKVGLVTVASIVGIWAAICGYGLLVLLAVI